MSNTVTRQRTARSTPLAAREASKQATREALLDAGTELFGEQGLDAPSLDTICDRAGFTRGAFYVHFRDRDAFLEAVMARVGVSFLDAVLGTGEEGEDLAATVQRFVAAVASGAYPLTRQGGVRPHQLLDACVRSPAIRARYVALVEDSLARTGHLVKRGQREGTLRSDLDAPAVASIILAAVIGAQTMIELRVPVDLVGASGALLTMLSEPAKRGDAGKKRQRKLKKRP
jgi:TetR/AcrR family transcriptional repressor of nem operon